MLSWYLRRTNLIIASQKKQQSTFSGQLFFLYWGVCSFTLKLLPQTSFDPTFHSPKLNNRPTPKRKFHLPTTYPFRGQLLVSGLAFQNCGPNVSCISGFKYSRQLLGTLLGRWFSSFPVWWDMDSFPGGYLCSISVGLTLIISLVFRPRNQGYRRIARQEPGIIGVKVSGECVGLIAHTMSSTWYHLLTWRVNVIPSNLIHTCHIIK